MAEKIRAIHEGNLTIGETELKVAVLQDGTRLINYSGVFKAFGRTKRGAQKDGSRAENMPAFLNSKNLQEFVGQDLLDVLAPLNYTTINGAQSKGYDASILPMICKVYMDARASGKLKSQQEAQARASEILLISLSKVGIIALVDEATGYQHEREKDALNMIFKTLISDEILSWQKQFHLSFYREIYKLWKIPFTERNIRYKPQFLGHLTNKYIYANLPKGSFVLDELKKRTPKSKKGNYKVRFHQSLTEDKGREALKKVLYTIEALASVSKDKREFNRLVNERYGQKEIPFTDLDELSELDETPPKPDGFNKKLKQALDFNPNSEN